MLQETGDGAGSDRTDRLDCSEASDGGLMVVDATGHATAIDLEAVAASSKTLSFNQRFTRMWHIPDNTLDRIRAEHELRLALEREEIEVYLQPQADVRTNRLVGAEALARWRHPERGLVLPDEFIPIAEESGLIISLGEQVLRTVCRQVVQRRRRRLPPMRIAVNLSAVQFQDPALVATVAGALNEADLEPSMLEFEVTESTAMRHAALAGQVMRELASLGVTISLDDFGTGYSSLQYLKEFPLDALKIDRSFVQEVGINQNSTAIVSAVIAIGESLDLNVIAEGIETTNQLSTLRQRNCPWYQGYLLARPMPAEAFDALLERQAA
jgi:EAL domain-containing protein (putative c-di-GMP-specific phosphodiesterase class I)